MLEGCPNVDRWNKDVPRNITWPVTMGAVVLLAWAVGFGAWATLAPLDGAVVASGTFVATGQNKQVQHLEGGIVREMLAKEGDLVEAGQTLVRLDDTAANAKLRRLTLRKIRLAAIGGRLAAEINGLPGLSVPSELAAHPDDPEVRSILDGQKAELSARRAKLNAEELVLAKEISALEESIAGYQSQVKSTQARLVLFDEELKDKTALLERQLVRKTEILALQRSQASLAGDLGELMGRVADARERIARANQQIAQLRSAAIQQAVEELRKTEAELDDVQEQIRAARDVVDRVEVRAPVRGIVVKLNHNTPGGVIGAGAVILELLPVNDELVIEARIRANDIAHVRDGQPALVRVTALNQRLIPMIEGKVMYVSADTVPMHQDRTHTEMHAGARDTFIVRVRLDDGDVRRKAAGFQPTPGMPADIFVRTVQRTFLDYMMTPVRDSFSRAFRES